MSRQHINEYRAQLDRLRAISGSRRESVLREAFKDLLKRWGRAHDLQFVAEHDILTKQMTRIYVDGALLHVEGIKKLFKASVRSSHISISGKHMSR